MTSYDSAESNMTALRSFECARDLLKPRFWSRRSKASLIQQSRNTPKISEAREQASLSDRPAEVNQLNQAVQQNKDLPGTVLYLAYGSNLSALTFRERRGINPLSQVNVVVPEIKLTFDLAGIPYTEPCFGNSQYRAITEKGGDAGGLDDHHKDRWTKGLVGVVYEVTMADFAHIIETEGGGSGYKDVLVDCYTLDDDPSQEVPTTPSGNSFKAHTLYAPGRSRPDPSYAQPSDRYKKLITDGAEECNLPYEYRTYLDGIRTYQLTTQKQKMGLWIFTSLWLPILGFIFLGGGKIFLRKNGTYPQWFVNFAGAIFAAVWASYDNFFKPTFGDGERSIEDGGSDAIAQEDHSDLEKTPLLRNLRSARTKASQDVV